MTRRETLLEFARQEELMADDLPLVPELPATLREAAFRGKLIPFIGAGVSVLAGCPNWEKLADDAFQCFIANDQFSHAQVDQIKWLRPRIKLSIARGLQEKHGVRIDFKQLLQPAAWRDSERGTRLYASLARLGNTFVTTNYDEWLDEERAAPLAKVKEEAAPVNAAPRPRSVFFRKAEFTAANLNQPNTVIHLHGSVKEPAGMVVTTSDYIEHYKNDRRGDQENPVLTFLDNLFQEKFVLFIGYGLDELEILEYVILKSKQFKTAGLEPRHFILQGFFSHERELMLNMRDYYDQCGIGLLPFLKDRKGWDQLLDVIEDLGSKAPASQLMLADEFAEMARWMNE